MVSDEQKRCGLAVPCCTVPTSIMQSVQALTTLWHETAEMKKIEKIVQQISAKKHEQPKNNIKTHKMCKECKKCVQNQKTRTIVKQN